MTVDFLLHEMRYEELLGWFAYLGQKPIGWRGYDQTAALLQAQGAKGKPWALFPILDPIYNPPKEEGFDIKGFKSSVFFQKLQGAKGGEVLDYEQLESRV